ncbi:hypothetical protein SF83666_b68640 (plasmid) [Sinorhizobium fredii CCBAU 83666]|nr:hypothetical protein SF83666_b68640 [Sinorhizobium fredii CCBAU 83666]
MCIVAIIASEMEEYSNLWVKKQVRISARLSRAARGRGGKSGGQVGDRKCEKIY